MKKARWIPVLVVMALALGGCDALERQAIGTVSDLQTEDGQEFCILHQEPIPEEENGYVQVGKEQLYVYESPVH